jgi:hypothetical protein
MDVPIHRSVGSCISLGSCRVLRRTITQVAAWVHAVIETNQQQLTHPRVNVLPPESKVQRDPLQVHMSLHIGDPTSTEEDRFPSKVSALVESCDQPGVRNSCTLLRLFGKRIIPHMA